MDLVHCLGVVGDGGGEPLLRDVPRAAEFDVPSRLGFGRLVLMLDAAWHVLAPAVLVRERIAVEFAPTEEDLRVLNGTVVERGLARGEVVRMSAFPGDAVPVPVALETGADEDGERIEDPEFLVCERSGGQAIGSVVLVEVGIACWITVVRIAVQQIVFEFAAEEEFVSKAEEIGRAGVCGAKR